MNIIVIDSIMGSGKSTWARQYMNSHPEKRWMFVTPYLKEMNKVQEECSHLGFREPDNTRSHYNKSDDLISLIYSGENIATTHSLFLRIQTNEDLLKIIQSKHYNLIVDETLDVVRHEKIPCDDINALVSNNVLKINKQTNTVSCSDDYQGAYRYLRESTKTGTIYSYQEEALVWLYNPHIFQAFDSMYVLTYLFEGTRMKCYFKFYNLQYETYYIENGLLFKGSTKNAIIKQRYEDLIDIYQGHLNDVAKGKRAFYYLSKNWYLTPKNKQKINAVKKNAYNYLHNIRKAKSGIKGNALYTIFLEINQKSPIISYKKSFLQCNQKASNEYIAKDTLAYLVNIFEDPEIGKFFSKYRVKYDESLYALNSMIQWIWRSAIRDGNQIHIYLPSERMRNLLVTWIKDY